MVVVFTRVESQHGTRARDARDVVTFASKRGRWGSIQERVFCGFRARFRWNSTESTPGDGCITELVLVFMVLAFIHVRSSNA